MEHREYDRIKSVCWANGFKVDVCPTKKRGYFEIKVRGQRLKNTETDGYIFTTKKKSKELWNRVELAYINIYKKLKKDGRI